MLPISRDLTFIAGTSQLPAATANNIQDSIIALLKSTYFGDGSDGDVDMETTNSYNAFSSKAGATYTLNRDLYALNLTLSSSAKLDTANFRVFVRGTADIAVGSKILNNGVAGIGTLGGVAPGAGSLQGGGNGGAGGTTGTPGGIAGGPKTASLGGAGGIGGTGDSTGSSVAGGASGAATRPTGIMGGYHSLRTLISAFVEGIASGTAVLTGLAGGGGGGGGHFGALTGDSSNGGAGGSGAGTMVFNAAELVLNGTVEAIGGNGAAAALATGSGFAGGGGSGGGGGTIFCTYGKRSGAGSISVAGGAGGAAHAGGGDGNAGAVGTLIETNVGL